MEALDAGAWGPRMGRTRKGAGVADGQTDNPATGEIGETAAVVIGRNEGARLEACLASLAGLVGQIVYVDSGSTDGSVAAARAVGAEVVALDTHTPFTAARARNAGLARLDRGRTRYVQLIDGDCSLQPGWLAVARTALEGEPALGVACGRRRERAPEASVYNLLCDLEWDTPVGPAKACGGDALCRLEALDAVGGFNPALIAGEEPELCLRLRAAGWEVERLAAEMTLHDAAMTRFGQWWRRARRAGHAFAEGAHLHGGGPEHHWVAETRRALLWGLALPLAILGLALAVHPGFLVLALVYPAQVVRLEVKSEYRSATAWKYSFFTVLGKFPEALGVVQFHLNRWRNRKARIVEYK